MKDNTFDPAVIGRVVAGLQFLLDIEKDGNKKLQLYTERLEALLIDIVGEVEEKGFVDWADEIVKDFNYEKTMFRNRKGIYDE